MSSLSALASTARTEASADDFVLVPDREKRTDPELIRKLTSWLKPTDYFASSGEYHRHLASRAAGTGLWLRQTAQYQQWHNSDAQGSLWIKGVPGAGKSVVAASVIDALQQEDAETPVLFFFFRQIVAANHSARAAVQDWLAQLLPYSPDLQLSMKDVLESKLEDVSTNQLWDHLLASLCLVDRAYCVVDALDEMDAGNAAFLRRLDNLSTYKPASIKLLMTSRPKQYLQSALKSSSIIHVSLEQELVGDDIFKYLQSALNSSSIVHVSPEEDFYDWRLKNDILCATICWRSQGLFLYARLITDQILETGDVNVQQLAETLPVGLEEMYNTMLAKAAVVARISQDCQLFILRLVTLASRPLRLNELAAALIFHSGLPQTLAQAKQTVRESCAPLLEIQMDESISVIHHSLTEFLFDASRLKSPREQFPVVDPQLDHRSLTLLCINYMRSSKVREDPYPAAEQGAALEETDGNDGGFNYQSKRLQFPFLDYVVRHWAYHAAIYDKACVDESQLSLFFQNLDEFLASSNPALEVWTNVELEIKPNPAVSNELEKLLPALHAAAYAGIDHYALRLLNDGADPNSAGVSYRTPLHWAASMGHSAIVRELLRKGAEPNLADERGLVPLHEAAKKDHAEAARLLLEAGVDPLTPKTRENHPGRLHGGERITKGETAVEYAAEAGHVETVRAMIPFMQKATIDQALCLATSHGRAETVQLLLEECSSDPTYDGQTALYLSASASLLEACRTLLHGGADPNRISGWKPSRWRRLGGSLGGLPMTPLDGVMNSSGSDGAKSTILKMLTEAGADLERKDRQQETPLLAYLADGNVPNEDVVKTLVECGARLDVKDSNGDFPLHRCIRRHKDLGLIGILLANGANIDILGHDQDTVLHCAVGSHSARGMEKRTTKSTYKDIVTFLLDRGADPRARNSRGMTPFLLAFSNPSCDLDVVRRLAASATRSELNTSLHMFSYRRDNVIAIIKEMLALGADIETPNPEGASPFLASATGLRSDFLECGAQVNAVDNAGRNAIHRMGSHTLDSMRSLVEVGVDPMALDNAGDTILHKVVCRFRGVRPDIELVQYVLDLGIRCDTKNKAGRTALHTYLDQGRVWSSTHPQDELERSSLVEIFQRHSPSFDIDAQDAEGITPLHLAVEHSEFHTDRLLKAGSNLRLLTNQGMSVMHLASKSGQCNTIGRLLSLTGQSLLDEKDDHGNAPLHYACQSGRPEAVLYLLTAGASVNVKDKTGQTSLHKCASAEEAQLMDRRRPDPKSGQRKDKGDRFKINEKACTIRGVSIVRSLLEYGADAQIVDMNGKTPYDLVNDNSYSEIAKLLAPEPFQNVQYRGLMESLWNDPSMAASVIQDPMQYLRLMAPEDLRRIIESGHDISCARNIETYPARSILHELAAHGLLDLLAEAGGNCKLYDDPEWTRQVLRGRGNDTDHLRPVLQAACDRELPNLGMFAYLIEVCKVDVNAHALSRSSEYDQSGVLVPGPTALHCLARAKNFWQLDAIKFLVDKGAGINAVNERGETPLHIASKGNVWTNMCVEERHWSLDAVRLLLQLGADCNVVDSHGLTCLNKASDAPEILEELLYRGADATLGRPGLLSAVAVQNVATARILLDHGANANVVDVDKSCPVHYELADQDITRYALLCAARLTRLNCRVEDSAPVVELLLERGADYMAPLNENETLIHHVFEHADWAILTSVMNHGTITDWNARDQRGRTIFLAACDWQEQTSKYISGAWVDRAMPAMTLLEKGADITAVDAEGRNALHHLVKNHGRKEETILKIMNLPACQPLLFQKDHAGFSPLHTALANLRTSISEALVARGADLLERDPDGLTALHHLARGLEQSDARISQKTEGPDFSRDCIGLWKRYLTLGGDVDDRSPAGETPLFVFLAARQHYRIASKTSSCHVDSFDLFFAGADALARNGAGETALHVVARRDRSRDHDRKVSAEHDKKLFKLLMRKGVDPLAEDDRGRSSLDVADVNGRKEILELFKHEKK